jgi:hypothetical protein
MWTINKEHSDGRFKRDILSLFKKSSQVRIKACRESATPLKLKAINQCSSCSSRLAAGYLLELMEVSSKWWTWWGAPEHTHKRRGSLCLGQRGNCKHDSSENIVADIEKGVLEIITIIYQVGAPRTGAMNNILRVMSFLRPSALQGSFRIISGLDV